MATIDVKDATGATQTIQQPNANGRASAANSRPVALSNEDLAAVSALPTGAATSAKQPALGIAGTPATDVLSVQGAVAMTALKVDGSAVTQPVSGTVTVAGTVPVSGTFWQATQPVSAAALPLPSGAATAAKQPALGTSGAPSADVLSVQGSASMTALKVDASATTQPVSGTISIAGTVPVSGAFWQATQPVSAATLPLPTGAATAAKQPALGTAGTPSADVLSVQGSTSMTALKVDGSAVIQPVSAAALPLPSGAATDAKVEAVRALLAATIATAPIASENHIGKVGGESAIVSASFVRPADTVAYAVGDLVANNVTAGSVTPMPLAAARINAGTGAIRRVRLSTSKTGLAGTETFRVHLFKTTPTVTNGDNGVFSVNGVAANHLGVIDVTMDRVFNDGAKGFAIPLVGSEIVFDTGAATTNLFALIEARTAYTPASGETFTLALEVLRD